MAMRAGTVRLWSRIHTWTSLVCTAFLLMLCLTGLPLIFHHEIEHLLGQEVEGPAVPPGARMADLDQAMAAALARRPGEVALYASWDPDAPGLLYLTTAPAPDSPDHLMRQVAVNALDATVVAEPDLQGGFMHVILQLHVDMFAGLPGKLFLGAMGLVFLAALVSGTVLYAPFMRRLGFGTVRRDRSPRARWLDLHNLLGVVTLAWVAVVGATGVINTLDDVVFGAWRRDQLAAMTAPYRGLPPLEAPGSLARAVAVARETVPGMVPRFVAFPGTPFSSAHHHTVFLRGDTPLTGRLLRPVLVDARTGTLTATAELPWYVTTLLVSQPLHFGDYGGLPLKIVWALLDVASIAVLGSGLWLWAARRRTAAAAAAPPLAEPTR